MLIGVLGKHVDMCLQHRHRLCNYPNHDSRFVVEIIGLANLLTFENEANSFLVIKSIEALGMDFKANSNCVGAGIWCSSPPHSSSHSLGFSQALRKH